MSSYVVECFWPGVSRAELADLDRRATDSATAEVLYRGSMLIGTDEVVFCFFDGPTAAAVTTVAERARIPFARVLESTSVPDRSTHA